MGRGAVHQGGAFFGNSHAVQTLRVGGTIEIFHPEARALGSFAYGFHQAAFAHAGAAFDIEHSFLLFFGQDVVETGTESL